jgi:hypothetical protein
LSKNCSAIVIEEYDRMISSYFCNFIGDNWGFAGTVKYYDFASGSVWVWNLVSDTKGGIFTAGVPEQCAEKNI